MSFIIESQSHSWSLLGIHFIVAARDDFAYSYTSVHTVVVLHVLLGGLGRSDEQQ